MLSTIFRSDDWRSRPRKQWLLETVSLLEKNCRNCNCSYFTSRANPKSHRGYKKHNKLYIELIGKLMPKMHFLLHYPRIMLLYGPAIHFSAMKYERKNKQLKEIAVGTSSNTNLPLTIAVKHQLQLYFETVYCPPVQSNLILDPVKNSYSYNALQHFPNLLHETPIMTLKYVELLGIKLSSGAVLLTKFSESGPHFGIIINIFFVKMFTCK